MERRRTHLGHVATGTVFFRDGTSGAGFECGFLFRGRGKVALQAVRIVRRGVMNERFVRVVAGSAGEPRVAFGPAAAVLETVRREAHVESSGRAHVSGDDVLPGAVAGAAEIDGVNAFEPGWIENES